MRIVFVYTAQPDYRQGTLDVIVDRFKDSVQIFCGQEYFDPTIRTSVTKNSRIKPVVNHYFAGRRLLFQTRMWRPALRADVAVFELNPRIVSEWLLLVIRKCLGRKSVLWGHAWPRGGKHQRSDQIRHLLRLLSDTIIVYTETEATELREKMPNGRIIAAPNALYSRSVMGAHPDRERAKNLICVGRLVPPKKPMLLLEAFASVVDKLPSDCDLVFVGDGPLRSDLENRTRKLGLRHRVAFEGHVSDFGSLRELYSEAVASVSPGYVGLSITQSFSFGVPMIIARDEPHSPEIEAAVEEVNSLMFASDSRSSLSETILALMRDRDSWIERREAIAAYCADRYSLETVADRAAQAVLWT